MISVLICVYNGESYIKETINSLLLQTYKDFEILVIVNCTNDSTIKILEDFNDNRIKIFQTNICQLSYNLNYGLMKSNSKYVVRIDADDIAEPTRIEKQFKFIEDNNFDVVGSNVELIDEYGKFIGEKKYPEDNIDIRKKIFYTNPLAHPTIIYKKSTILKVGGYMNGKVSEDYDLWLRLMRDKKIKFYNMQEKLTLYRIHTNQARGNKLAYYEICGYMIRETFYQKSFKFFIGFLVYLAKSIIK
ncbi:glycosyltransferase [Aliarcobacter cryaerophilus]|uniref:Glycosyltransferase, family 2 n=1 Tax=Aliarcobacter cryaerophilus ATCC 43158 TaxID=1032070 RepID=A0AAD0X8P4_9BACT|nr:glycosyltransferase [Aliarcobacter cryaerophilus]AYJ79914.1 glycosyltransferase, family 2 [Aliarcobacter cryaerophilus ATCC 43158]